MIKEVKKMNSNTLHREICKWCERNHCSVPDELWRVLYLANKYIYFTKKNQ